MAVSEVTGTSATVIAQTAAPGGLVAVLLSFVGVLPVFIGAIAGLSAACFYFTMFWESKTMQEWRRSSRTRKGLARLAALHGERSDIIAKLHTLGVDVHISSEDTTAAGHRVVTLDTTQVKLTSIPQSPSSPASPSPAGVTGTQPIP